jgi:hypothetical protein
MKKRQILWAIVFGSMLAITGCGDEGDPGSGGSNGSGGSGSGGSGTGGSNGGPSSSTCEAICSSTCALQGVDPDANQCLTQCEVGIPQFDDDCGSQADAYLSCIEGVNCDPEANECQSEAIAWGTCIAF